MRGLWNTVTSGLADAVGGLIYIIFKSIMLPFADVYTVDELIFGDIGGSNDTIYWGTFNAVELQYAFIPMYYTILSLAGIFYVTFIVMSGIRLAGSSMNARKRNELFELTKELVLVTMGFFFLPQFYTLVFEINMLIVSMFDSLAGKDPFDIDIGINEDEAFSKDQGLMGKIVITLLLFGIGLWANFYYLMRRITLIILMAIGPLMLVFWMFPNTKGLTVAWFKEFIGTVFIQSIHAFVWYIVAVISIAEANAGMGIIAICICYLVFIPLAEQLKNLMGLSSGMVDGLNKAGAMMGMAALGGMLGATKAALGGRSVGDAMKSLKGGFTKAKDSKDSGKSLTDSLKDGLGATKDGLKAIKAGDIVSDMGKALGGIGGSLAGAPLGPAGAGIGAILGGGSGALAGGIAGRTGYMLANGISKRFKGAKEGMAAHKDAINNGEENLENAIANQEAAAWSGQSKEQTMQNLQEQFPSATKGELEQKYNDIVKSKAAGFKKNASNTLSEMRANANATGNGEQLTQAAAEGAVKQWEKENPNFAEQWKQNNPRQDNESEQAHNQRAQQALNTAKGNVRDSVLNAGAQFTKNNHDGSGNVNREALAKVIGEVASTNGISKDGQAFNSSIMAKMDGVKGPAMFDSKGTPNMPVISNAIASLKVNQDRQAFINSNPNMSPQEAGLVFDTKMADQSKATHLAAFSGPKFQQSLTGITKEAPSSKFMGMVQNTGAAVSGAFANDVQNLKTTVDVVSAGTSHAFQNVAQNVKQHGVLKGIGNTVNGANKAATTTLIENFGGDAVAAQSAITDTMGYAGAVILGQRGHDAARSMAVKMQSKTHLGQAVQSQISSIGEVQQMAHKVLDDNGNLSIPAGAIRQVTTADKSYIEVRTSSGETRVVSQMGGGLPGLSKGEVIYQDLLSNNDGGLDIAQVGRSGVSTYKMDATGTRIPVNASVLSPYDLLGNPDSAIHGHVQRPVHKPLMERVDAGTFHLEDLAYSVKSGQLKDVKVVIDKGSQYLTATKGDQTYRVSPIMDGDARLGSNESLAIPVEVLGNGQITVPKADIKKGLTGAVGQRGILTRYEQVEGTLATEQVATGSVTANVVRQNVTQKANILHSSDGNGLNILPTQQTLGVNQKTAASGDSKSVVSGLPNSVIEQVIFQASKQVSKEQVDFSHMLMSRNQEMVQRNLERRQYLDSVRMKQGRVY